MLPFMLRAAGAKYRPAEAVQSGPSTAPPGTPILWYTSSEIPNSWGQWPNKGSLGTGYNLIPYSGTPSISTLPDAASKRSVLLNGTNLQFANSGSIQLHAVSSASPMLIAAVVNFGGSAYLGIVGSQGLSTTLPNGFGAFAFPSMQEAYDNDGVPVSFTAGWSAGTSTQLVILHDTSNNVYWYEAKTSGAIVAVAGSYGAAFTIRGVTGMRSVAASNAYISELVVYNTNHNTTFAQSVRDWLGSNYAGVGRVNA